MVELQSDYDKNTYEVATVDRASRKQMTHRVGGPEINSQEDAEVHVATMARAMGGKHPGFDVQPKDAERFAKRAKELNAKIEDPAQ